MQNKRPVSSILPSVGSVGESYSFVVSAIELPLVELV